jgi:hypothetical protein
MSPVTTTQEARAIWGCPQRFNGHVQLAFYGKPEQQQATTVLDMKRPMENPSNFLPTCIALPEDTYDGSHTAPKPTTVVLPTYDATTHP